MVPPSCCPISRYLLMVSSCIFELIAPMSVFLSSGSPTIRVSIRSRSLRDHVLCHRLLHQQPRARTAHVALVEEDAVDDALHGLVDGGILEDDVGRLAAKLQRVTRAPAGQRLLDNARPRRWSR